jgi:hypothetical protein
LPTDTTTSGSDVVVDTTTSGSDVVDPLNRGSKIKGWCLTGVEKKAEKK